MSRAADTSTNTASGFQVAIAVGSLILAVLAAINISIGERGAWLDHFRRLAAECYGDHWRNLAGYHSADFCLHYRQRRQYVPRHAGGVYLVQRWVSWLLLLVAWTLWRGLFHSFCFWGLRHRPSAAFTLPITWLIAARATMRPVWKWILPSSR